MAGWSIPLDKLAEKVQLDLETVARRSTLDLFTAVVLKSPVDTGRFRANWNVSQGAPDITVTNSTDKNRAKAEVDKVQSLPVGGITYLSNSLPYATVLEYGQYPNPPKMGSKKRGEDGIAVHVRGGYSMQAPQGMVRISALEYNDYVKRAISK
jgi:hypothetical protein